MSRTEYIVGETWEFDIGVARIEQHYQSLTAMHYRVLTGPHAGNEESVTLEVHLIRPGVFLTSWREASGVTVVHVEDFDNNTFYTHATTPEGGYHRRLGEMRRVR